MSPRTAIARICVRERFFFLLSVCSAYLFSFINFTCWRVCGAKSEKILDKLCAYTVHIHTLCVYCAVRYTAMTKASSEQGNEIQRTCLNGDTAFFSFIFLLCAWQYRRYASQAECGRKFLTDNWICEWILLAWVQVHMIFIWSDSNLPIGRIAFCARSWTCGTHNDCENETDAVRYTVSFYFQFWPTCNRENRFICMARHQAVEVRVSRSSRQSKHKANQARPESQKYSFGVFADFSLSSVLLVFKVIWDNNNENNYDWMSARRAGVVERRSKANNVYGILEWKGKCDLARAADRTKRPMMEQKK